MYIFFFFILYILYNINYYIDTNEINEPEVVHITATTLPATIVLTTAMQQSNNGPNHIMTYPLSELLEDAFVKGLVVVEVLERIHMNDLVQYHIETQVRVCCYIDI